MRILRTFDEFDINQWRMLSAKSDYSGFFQTPECYRFYERQDFFEPFVFGIEDNDELKCVIVGYIQKEPGVIKGYLSRRAIINAGPLLSSSLEESHFVELLREMRKVLGRKAIYAEIRNFFNYGSYLSAFGKGGFEFVPHLNFQIDTTSLEMVGSRLGKSRKRDIKVSLRDGAQLITSPTDRQIEEYYAILQDLYRTKVKTPLFPLSFFKELNRIPEGHLVLVEYDNKIVGGTVCVGIPGQPLYEWFACGMDGVYKNIHSSTLATYGGIQYAAQNGFPVFDMMGAGKPDEGYGVRDFKAKFGGELVEDGRFLAVLNPVLYKLGTAGVKILKKMR